MENKMAESGITKEMLANLSNAVQVILEAAAQAKPDAMTRFRDMNDFNHPFYQWWEHYGQYMLSGGGKRGRFSSNLNPTH